MAFQEKSDVPSDSVCHYDDYFYDEQYNEIPDYFDYDELGDFDSYHDVYGFIEPDDYEFIMIFMGQMTVGCNVYLEVKPISLWAR